VSQFPQRPVTGIALPFLLKNIKELIQLNHYSDFITGLIIDQSDFDSEQEQDSSFLHSI
jgi:hypothetical protein